MEAKEKAKELFDRYFLKMENGIDENKAWICMALNKGMAKGCALIAVNEIIDSHYISLVEVKQKIIDYWQEVKIEIEKL